jgi:hypothetical protein
VRPFSRIIRKRAAETAAIELQTRIYPTFLCIGKTKNVINQRFHNFPEGELVEFFLARNNKIFAKLLEKTYTLAKGTISGNPTHRSSGSSLSNFLGQPPSLC